jgi:hypothetical protein
MALSKTVKKTIRGYDGFVSVDNCYIKVTSISGDKNKIDYTIGFYNGDKVIESSNYSFTPDMTGENFIKQAYTHLKTLPEFEGATDV